jgi:hypothetical protein
VIKDQLKWIIDLNIKLGTRKLLEKNIEGAGCSGSLLF